MARPTRGKAFKASDKAPVDIANAFAARDAVPAAFANAIAPTLVATNLAIKIVFAALSNVTAVVSALTARPIPTNIAVVAPIG